MNSKLFFVGAYIIGIAPIVYAQSSESAPPASTKGDGRPASLRYAAPPSAFSVGSIKVKAAEILAKIDGYLDRGEIQLASQYLLDAIKDDSLVRPYVVTRQIELRLLQGDFTGVLESFRTISQEQLASDVRLRIMMSAALLGEKRGFGAMRCDIDCLITESNENGLPVINVPQSIAVTNNLAWCYAAIGSAGLSSSVSFYELALKEMPNNSDISRRLISVLAEKMQFARAAAVASIAQKNAKDALSRKEFSMMQERYLADAANQGHKVSAPEGVDQTR